MIQMSSLFLWAGIALLFASPILVYCLSLIRSRNLLKLKLEKRKKSYTQFIINLRHEIKTPISIIVGKTKILAEALDMQVDSRIEQDVQSIEKNSRRLLKIVDELSFFQEIDVENYVINKVEFSSHRFFNGLIEAIVMRDKKSKDCIKLTIEKSVPDFLFLDTFALKNAITPIISNAIKFSNYDEAAVNVSTTSKNKGKGANLVITIKDKGIGLEKIIQEKMYYPFFQGDSSLSRLYGGLGLGLTMAKKLVGLLDGKIKCTSQVGKGTEFTILIPYNKSDSPTTKVSVANLDTLEHTPIQAPRVTDSPPRILFVDDLEEMRSLYKYFVRNLPITCLFAENGREALKIVKKQKLNNEPIDLIFMDLQMPILNGYQATTLMRQQGLQLPIVAVTAHFAPDGDTMRNEHGFQNIIVKPIDEEVLSRQMQKYLGMSRFPKRLKEA